MCEGRRDPHLLPLPRSIGDLDLKLSCSLPLLSFLNDSKLVFLLPGVWRVMWIIFSQKNCVNFWTSEHQKKIWLEVSFVLQTTVSIISLCCHQPLNITYDYMMKIVSNLGQTCEDNSLPFSLTLTVSLSLTLSPSLLKS